MRRLKIIWGYVEQPVPGADTIYGGCCVLTDPDGQEMRFGYVCSACEAECKKDPDADIPFEYVIENGQIVPLMQ